MIEVNRKLYLDDNFKKSENFEKIHTLIGGLLAKLGSNNDTIMK